MVYWDQLGCGINDRSQDGFFTIAHFVGMATELISKIRADYRVETVNLFGVSRGSILAARVAVEIPDLINRVLVYDQVVFTRLFDQKFIRLRGHLKKVVGV